MTPGQQTGETTREEVPRPDATGLTHLVERPVTPRAATTPGKGHLRALLWLMAGTVILALAAWLVARSGIAAPAREVFSSAGALRNFVAGFGAWGPVVFFFVQVAQVVFAPIPGNVTTVVGAVLFGLWGGLALGISGAMVGSAIVFFLGRRWGRPLVARLVGEELYERYAGLFDAKGWLLFVVMLLPFLPDDAVCALAGISAVSFRRFLVLVTLGRLPSTAAAVFVATDAASLSAAALTTMGLALTAVIITAFAYRKRVESWLLSRAATGREDPWQGPRHDLPAPHPLERSTISEDKKPTAESEGRSGPIADGVAWGRSPPKQP